MGLLEEWLGPEEMAENGGLLRVRWVRNCPDLVEQEIAAGKDLERTNHPDKPRKRGAYLNWYLCQRNGVRKVTDMPLGPAPR